MYFVKTGLLMLYVSSFNATDQETVVNAYPNSDAADFLRRNVPRFECPDKEIEKTYYFRWWTLRKHLRRNDFGWTVSEFLPPVGYAGPGNTIVCPAGHHLRETRWLRDPVYAEDLARFWFSERAGHRTAYGTWLASSVLAVAAVTGNSELPRSLLDAMVANYSAWERTREARSYPSGKPFPFGGDGHGGFLTTDDREGTELTLSGDGYRPLLNASMWGEARAIAETARAVGRNELAETFEAKAAVQDRWIRENLWNPDVGFFTTRATNGVQSSFCELHGYAPWYFGMENLSAYATSWRRLVDEKGFLAPFGLTFVTRDAEGFSLSREGHACKWNGPSWPFATSVALTALARILQNGDDVPLTADDFVSQLHTYAAAHRLKRPDGVTVCWIDENLDPFTGEWLARAIRGNSVGKDYNHSTFCDLVISGLCGLVPRSDGLVDVRPLAPRTWPYFALEGVRYHGHEVSVHWDLDGTRYGLGRGLTVTVDGKTQCLGMDRRRKLLQ